MKVSATAPVPPDSTASGARIYAQGEPGLKMPVVISEARPHYTEETMRAKISGPVELSCVVETDGTVREAAVKTSLHPVLDEQAVLAARQWRFTPGTKDGIPVRVRVSLSMTFTLR